MKQTNNLLKMRFSSLKYEKKKITTLSLIAIIILAISLINLVPVLAIQDKDIALAISNVLVLVNTVLISIFSVLIVLWLFKQEHKDHIVKMELNKNISINRIFFSRFIFSIGVIASLFILLGIVNVIAIASIGFNNSGIGYHAFISSLGWYVILSMISFSLTILFCMILKTYVVTSLIMVIVLVMTALASFASSAVTQDYQGHGETNITYNDMFNKKSSIDIYSEMKQTLDADEAEKFFYNDESSIVSPYGWTQTMLGYTLFSKNETSLEYYNENYKTIVDMYRDIDRVIDQNLKKQLIDKSKIISITGNNRTLLEEKSVNVFDAIINKIDSKYKNLLEVIFNYYKNVGDINDSYALINSFGDVSQENYKEFVYFKNQYDYNINKFIFYKTIALSLRNTVATLKGNKTDTFADFNRQTNRVSKAVWYNPVLQFSLLFYGVKYKDNLTYSMLAGNSFVPTLSAKNVNNNGSPIVKRTVKAEFIYLGYFIINVVWITIGYLIYRKKVRLNN